MEEKQSKNKGIVCTKLVLEYKEDKNRTPVVEVLGKLIKKLKPHQVEGRYQTLMRSMFNKTYEINLNVFCDIMVKHNEYVFEVYIYFNLKLWNLCGIA